MTCTQGCPQEREETLKEGDGVAECMKTGKEGCLFYLLK